MVTEKSLLRKQALQARSGISNSDVVNISKSIQAEVIKSRIFKESEYIHCYYSIGKEVQTDIIISEALQNDKNIYIPDISVDNFRMYKLENMDQYKTIKSGLSKIKDLACAHEDSNVDLVILPVVAFDEGNNRIGMGGGWYDKFLELKKDSYKIGLAYIKQKVGKIPTEIHDVKMDEIFAE